MKSFLEITTEYEILREEQRMSIVTYLASKGFNVSKNKRAGKGRLNYTSGGTITSYDLRNFKYIDASKDGHHVFISLQPFERDPSSGNHHVLENRIGLYAYEKYDPEEAFSNMVITDIDLPMDDEKLYRLDVAIAEQLRSVM